MKNLLAKIKAKIDASAKIFKDAEAEGRELTDQEMSEVETHQKEVEALKRQVEALKAQEESENFLNESQGVEAGADQEQYNGGVAPSVNKKLGTNGFKNFGEYLTAVAMAGSKTAPKVDDRLIVKNDANTQVGKDGGFAIPTDFRQEITRKVVEEESLLKHFSPIMTAKGNTSRLVDQNDPSNPYGVEAYWTGEGKKIQKSEPELENFFNKTEKLAALIPVTNEALEDAPYLTSLIQKAAPAAMSYKINDAIFNGNGIAKPKGIMVQSHLLTLAKEGGQAADSIVFKNVLKMFEAMPASVRNKLIWFSGLNTLSQLMSLKDDNGNAVYIREGSIANKPYDMLLGRPKYETEFCAKLGDKGDLLAINPDAYEIILQGTGIKSDFSTHIYFDEDKSAFRFTFRIGGDCPFKSVITRKGSISQSNFVTLAERA